MAKFSTVLMDHFNAPRNAGEIDAADAIGKASHRGKAPRVTIYLRTNEAVITEAGFKSFGCGVSIACCSILTEMVTGRTISDCLTIRDRELVEALGGIPPEKRFCASLAVAALHDGLQKLSTD